MDKNAIAMVLEEIGTLLELQGADPFRVRAFQNAARALDALEGDVVQLARSGELEKLRGLGPTSARIVRELIESGVSSYHQELRRRTPEGLIQLLGVPGLGARRIHALHERLGITSLRELERAAAAGRIAELPGFGIRTQEKIREGVAYVRSAAGHRRQPEAYETADRVLGFVAALPGVEQAKLAGALRRRLEIVDGIDLVVAAIAAEYVDAVTMTFLELPGVASSERSSQGEARARLADGLELRLHCCAAAEFPSAWLHHTGSQAHLDALARRARERGLRLDARGLWRGKARLDLHDEAALYRALDLAFVVPELREGLDELAAAADGRLPRLVDYPDLRGCFHCHTTYSDGRATLREMAEAARARGWRYLGIADHSQAAAYAGGLSPDDVARQHDEIDAWNADRGRELWLFKGIETDILADGRLDFSDAADVLDRFDYVVGSVHSALGQPRAEQTRRVLRALEDPHLTFLGHPTGRLLLGRKGMELDMDAVIEAAAERGVGIEINSNPWRMELDWRWWRRAQGRGVRAAINPDAHSIGELAHVEYGVGVARKGWLTADDVVNAWELERVGAYFEKGRAR